MAKSPKSIGVSRIYNVAFADRGRTGVVMWEAIPIVDGEQLTLHFESVDSPWRQGVWLSTDEGITINGQTSRSMTLWQDTAPEKVPFMCHTKNGFLSFYNIWCEDEGDDTVESQSHTSGMIVEEFKGGLRYRCNDFGFDTQFQKLVFSIQRTKKRRLTKRCS